MLSNWGGDRPCCSTCPGWTLSSTRQIGTNASPWVSSTDTEHSLSTSHSSMVCVYICFLWLPNKINQSIPLIHSRSWLAPESQGWGVCVGAVPCVCCLLPGLSYQSVAWWRLGAGLTLLSPPPLPHSPLSYHHLFFSLSNRPCSFSFNTARFTAFLPR